MMGSGGVSESGTFEWDAAVKLDPLLLSEVQSAADTVFSNNYDHGNGESLGSNTDLHERLAPVGIVKGKSDASVYNPYHANNDLYFPVEGIDVDSFHQATLLQPQGMPLSPSGLLHGKKVVVNGKEMALFCHKGRFYAVEERCPHLGGPLHLGDIEDLGNSVPSPRVICPWHKWCFDLATGKHIWPPQRNKHIQSYPVRTDAKGTVFIGFSSFHPACFDTTTQEF